MPRVPKSPFLIFTISLLPGCLFSINSSWSNSTGTSRLCGNMNEVFELPVTPRISFQGKGFSPVIFICLLQEKNDNPPLPMGNHTSLVQSYFLHYTPLKIKRRIQQFHNKIIRLWSSIIRARRNFQLNIHSYDH